jgi:transposase-like protein
MKRGDFFMQMILMTDMKAEDYNKWVKENDVPDIPTKCPMCEKFTEFKKHGFYPRTAVTLEAIYLIYVRRYRCTKCGRTLSFLPQFCHPKFQYSILVIFLFLREILSSTSVNIEFALRILRCSHSHIDIGRQHIRFYLQRLKVNLSKLELTAREIDGRYKFGKHKKNGINGELVEFVYRYISTPQSKIISFNRIPLIPALSKSNIS